MPLQKNKRSQVQTRDRRRVIRVLAEGKATEPDYLRLVKGSHVRIQFRDTGGLTPMALVRQARLEVKENRAQKQLDFDEIWCVFDRDEHPDVNSAIEEARQGGVETALSNPCFELWLVLHVRQWAAHVHRHVIQRECRRLELTQGKRIVDRAEDQLLMGFRVAKQRAQKLDEMHEQAGSPRGTNPSSGVWRLVDRLQASHS